MSKIKYIIFLWVTCFFVTSSWVMSATSEELCGDMHITISGPAAIVPDISQTYLLQSSSLLDKQAIAEFELRSGSTLLTTTQDHAFVFTFTHTGTYLLKGLLRRGESCITSTSLPIIVSDRLWVEMGMDASSMQTIKQMSSSAQIYVSSLPALSTTMSQEELLDRLSDVAILLKYAEVFFIDASQVSLFFQYFTHLDNYGIALPTQVILVGPLQSGAIKRMLRQFPGKQQLPVFHIVPTPYLSVAVQGLIRKTTTFDGIEVIQRVDIDSTQTPRRSPMEKITDFLIRHHISPTVLTFLCIIPLLVFCLVFLKQVVGLDILSVSYTLMVSALLYFFGWKQLLFFFVVALLGHLLTQLFTKKLYLLHSAKIGLSVILTIFLLIGGYVLVVWFSPDHEMLRLDDPLPLFIAFMSCIFVVPTIIPSITDFEKRQRRKGFFSFLIVSAGGSLLFSRPRLQQVVLSHPDILVFVLIGTIFLGRYAGLQLTEYVLFWPLIKKYFAGTDSKSTDDLTNV